MGAETTSEAEGPTDRELLERLRAPVEADTRERALETLVRRHLSAVLAFLAGRTRDAELAAELTQQTFADAVAILTDPRSSAWPREPDRFRAWLLGIADRRRLNHYRRRGREAGRSKVLGEDRSLDDLPREDPERPDPADDPVRLHQARLVVQEVARTLPPDDRELYECYYREELSPARIAERLGRAAKTVNNRIAAIKTVVSEGFHAFLLVANDRTTCALLVEIVSSHPVPFSAELRDHVVKHTYNCARCGSCGQCRLCRVTDPARITSACTRSADCERCAVCHREHLALRADWAPALALLLFLRPVREAVLEVIRQTTTSPSDGGDHGDGDVGGLSARRGRPRGRRRLQVAAAGVSAAVVLAGGAYLTGLAGGEENTPADGPDAPPAAGTRIVSVVPVTASGDVRADHAVLDLSDAPLDGCGPPPWATAPDIVTCFPNSATAQACWVEQDRTTVLCGSPWEKRVRRHATSDGPVGPAEPRPEADRWPWALELDDGTRCNPRWGGPAPVLPGELSARYTCEGAGLVVEGADVPLIDRSAEVWTVQLLPPGGDTGSSPRLEPRRKVAAVYFAGRP
ncbi:sigma-70 family RNA polymerase sigma factor [Streptomyces durbertensis]|uniref:Sigma-70 family RNA polymerase sigma factor n=1 Tax=Streptomyces durbertensis TaxID=2448886 RepID=A0ABR6EC92_9ACTN|nr:sigma-70 family RNA polymerase sigma factor [Streptomyces durbertensis]MBB1242947.1 sigma-70 family RNA polymerase sigma factor [Streptomyces durbertensis]